MNLKTNYIALKVDGIYLTPNSLIERLSENNNYSYSVRNGMEYEYKTSLLSTTKKTITKEIDMPNNVFMITIETITNGSSFSYEIKNNDEQTIDTVVVNSGDDKIVKIPDNILHTIFTNKFYITCVGKEISNLGEYGVKISISYKDNTDKLIVYDDGIMYSTEEISLTDLINKTINNDHKIKYFLLGLSKPVLYSVLSLLYNNKITIADVENNFNNEKTIFTDFLIRKLSSIETYADQTEVNSNEIIDLYANDFNTININPIIYGCDANTLKNINIYNYYEFEMSSVNENTKTVNLEFFKPDHKNYLGIVEHPRDQIPLYDDFGANYFPTRTTGRKYIDRNFNLTDDLFKGNTENKKYYLGENTNSYECFEDFITDEMKNKNKNKIYRIHSLNVNIVENICPYVQYKNKKYLRKCLTDLAMNYKIHTKISGAGLVDVSYSLFDRNINPDGADAIYPRPVCTINNISETLTEPIFSGFWPFCRIDRNITYDKEHMYNSKYIVSDLYQYFGSDKISFKWTPSFKVYYKQGKLICE